MRIGFVFPVRLATARTGATPTLNRGCAITAVAAARSAAGAAFLGGEGSAANSTGHATAANTAGPGRAGCCLAGTSIDATVAAATARYTCGGAAGRECRLRPQVS